MLDLRFVEREYPTGVLNVMKVVRILQMRQSRDVMGSGPHKVVLWGPWQDVPCTKEGETDANG